MTKEDIVEINPEAIFYDGLDEAIIGIDHISLKPIYGVNKIISLLQKDMSYAEAVEWFDYNIVNLHIGDKTPIIL